MKLKSIVNMILLIPMCYVSLKDLVLFRHNRQDSRVGRLSPLPPKSHIHVDLICAYVSTPTK